MQSAVPTGLRIPTSGTTDKSVGYFHAVPTEQNVHLQKFGNVPLFKTVNRRGRREMQGEGA